MACTILSPATGGREIWVAQRTRCTIAFHTRRRPCFLTWPSIRDFFPKATSWRGDMGISPTLRYWLPPAPPAISGAQFCSRAPESGRQPSVPAMAWWVPGSITSLLCPRAPSLSACTPTTSGFTATATHVNAAPVMCTVLASKWAGDKVHKTQSVSLKVRASRVQSWENSHQEPWGKKKKDCSWVFNL